MYYFDLYIEFIKIRIQSISEYRGSFLSGILAQFLSYGADITLIWIMVNQFQTISGWGPFEVMFLYSLNLISYSISAFFLFNPCQELSRMIRNGEFDEVLIRPINSLLYLLTRSFNPAYVSHVSLSIITIIICFMNLNINLDQVDFLFLLIIIISGAMIQGSVFLITTIPVFWIIDGNNIMGLFYYNLKEFIRYPLSIYNKFIQVLLTVIIPYGFISFYPAQLILKKNDFLMFSSIIKYLSPVVGFILVLIAVYFWNIAVMHYESTGS